MREEIIKEIADGSGDRRVLIVRRTDGRFTYRKQERLDDGWSPPTIDAGVYDSAETAEMEARQRISWLRNLFH
jgi:hypothetical protein